MDDGSLIVLGLICVALVLLGPIGFFLTLGARSRLWRVEAELAALQAQLQSGRVPERESAAPRVADVAAPAAPSTQPNLSDFGESPREREEARTVPPDPISPAAPTDVFADAAAPEPAEPAPTAPEKARKVSIEERLGAHWAVIVGGIALAFGALLLVKYSIEQGFFGPGLRVICGLLLGAALVAGGEYLRRRDRPEGAERGAPIPSVLTGAGTIAAFGALYAAHALYGFIGPGVAFVLLGAVGLATMFAAALHGPALAGLGLLGALGAPLLISSSDPNPWPVVPYVAVVCAAAYGLARLRRWLWLAFAAAIGAALWEWLLLIGIDGVNGIDFSLAALVHLLLQIALAIVVFAFLPHRSVPQSEQRTDPIASLAVAGSAAVACFVLGATSLDGGAGPAWILTACLVAAMLVLTGVRLPAVAVASAAAGAVILCALASWGANMALIADPYAFFQKWPTPDSARAFVSFGLIASLALSALCIWRLLTPASLSLAKSAIYAGAAVLTPLGAISLIYLRLANLEASAIIAATAAAIGAAMAIGASIFHARRTSDGSAAITLGLGALAAGAIAALALGLVFVLSEGTLTVALALAALGSAYVAERLTIPALRWCVLGLALAVAGRFLYEPRIVGESLGKTVIFNWLLFGYGVPALAFGLAARLIRKSGEDPPMRVAQSLSILCAALLLFFEIRHALNDGDPFAPSSGMVEQGLFALVGAVFSLVLIELNARRADPIYRYAALGFSALTLAQAAFGLLLWQNPFFSGEQIEGGALFNALILAYLLPALAAFALARRSRGRVPEWRRIAASASGMVLLFSYLNLELRRLFQERPRIDFFASTGYGEFYAYSALWLILGVLLLAYGILAQSKPARLASAAVVSLTVVKVFLLDLAGLEGALRAFSFLGLGAALIGIGLVYQKFVFARRPTPDADPAAPPAHI